MKRPSSIAARLAAGLIVGTSLLWVGAAAISLNVLQHELNEAYDTSLRQSALRLLPLALHDLREPWERRQRIVAADGEDAGAATPDNDGDDAADEALKALDTESFSYFVRDATGAIVLRAADMPENVATTMPLNGFSEYNGQRTYSLTDNRSGYGIVLVEDSDQRSDSIRDSLMGLALPLVALVPLIALTIWFALRLVLRPLEELRREIGTRDSRNLDPISVDRQPRELRPFAETVGGLLGRLRAALEAERSFAARSAHELRTPIAGALAQTQQLESELQGDPRVERAHEIEQALRNLSGLAEKLLQLSRLEAGFARADTATDLVPVLRLMVRDANARAAWRDRVNLEIESGAALVAPVDPDAFAMIARNLIENALIHGREDGEVDVIVDAPGRLRVRSEGPALPPELLAQLGQPFVRGDTKAKGTGLGLSIVRSIIEQSGGSIRFLSPATGRKEGFEVDVTLPSEPTLAQREAAKG